MEKRGLSILLSTAMLSGILCSVNVQAATIDNSNTRKLTNNNHYGLMRAYHRTLRLGSSGDDVRDIQEKLAINGFYDVPDAYPKQVDGKFGELTRKAVISFQHFYGIAEDGVVGPATWAKFDSIVE